MDIWLLIDGSFLAYKFSGSDDPHRFMKRRIEEVVERVKPKYTILCWDSISNWRKDRFEGYKAGRSEKDPSVVRSKEILGKVGKELGLDQCIADKMEADDLIATAATIAKELGNRAVMWSSDRDLRQILVDGKISQLTDVIWDGVENKLVLQFMTAKKLEEDFGLRPDQWLDYVTLVGGKNDVPGVKGVGEKAATEFLQKGSIDSFLENPTAERSGLKGKKAEALVEAAEQLNFWRDLHRLNRAVEMRGDWLAEVFNELSLA